MKSQNTNVKIPKASVLVSFLSIAVLFQNCSNTRFSTVSSTSPQDIASAPATAQPDATAAAPVTAAPVVAPPAIVTVTPPPPVVVCNAFSREQTSSQLNGLKAELRYLDQSIAMTNDERVAFKSTDYFNDQDTRFLKAKEIFYFSDVNVPSRSFDAGFLNSNGKLLQDNQGNMLIEFFALKMETELKLSATDKEGYYDLATVSDDGTVIEMFQNGVWKRIIDNDGGHATKMGCTSQKIRFTKTSRIPIRIFYNQGQRMQIANVMYKNYRGPTSVTDSSVSSDTVEKNVCGVENFWAFWDPFTSEPKDLIKEIEAAGWKTMSAENFQIPDNKENPCAGL